MLCLLTGCRGGNQATTPITTVPATQATAAPTTMPTTESTARDTTPTMDNGNGPLDTQPQNGEAKETTGETLETNGTNQAQR